MLIETYVVSLWPLAAYALAAYVIVLGAIAMLDELA